VTVLFADMSGSVAATHGLDPEEALERVNEALEVMSRAVVRHGGRVDRYLGDGALALFGVPRASEDDALRAIAAALEMRDEARARGFDVTAGINTGDAYVGRVGSEAHRELTAMGPAVNLAARLQGRSAPGEVLVGETTWRLARRAFEFERRETAIKGLAEPVPAWVALGARPRLERARGLEGLGSALVGRDEELARLSAALESARSGLGTTVTIVGEAGVGKSRLVGELRRTALGSGDGDEKALWLEGRCFESTTSTSYAPFVDLLRDRFRDPVSSDPAIPEDVLVPLLNLLSFPDPRASAFGELPPAQVKARTFLAVAEYLRALADRRPVVVVLDDLHWADGLSLELVPRLVEALAESRALLVCVQRPAQEHGSRHLVGLVERHSKGRHIDLRLRPLDESEARRLVLTLLDLERFPEESLTAILEKAQGNPLFLEEVLRSLLSTDQISRGEGGIRVSARLRVDEVPTTVQSIIQSRVDRIDEEPRQVLQTAAVIGRLFPRGLLERTLGPGLDVDRALWQLEQHDLVHLERAVPEEMYSFEHVFTRDSVYKSLLKRRRADLHLAVGRAIEELYSDRIEEQLEQLAYHYDRTEDAGRAAVFLYRAGEKSRRAYLNDAALEAFERALTRLDGADGLTDVREIRAGIHESRGDVLELIGRHDEATEAYEHALGDRVHEERLARGRILRKVGGIRQVQWRKEDALAAFDRAVEELGARPEADPEWDEERAAVELGRIMVVYFTSTPEALAEQIERSRQVVETHGSALQRARFFTSLALLGLRRERYRASAATLADARRGYELLEGVEAQQEVFDTRFVYAFSLLWADRIEEAERHLSEILAEVDRVGYATVQARCVAYLALIARKRGSIDDARRWAERTLAVAETGGMTEYVAAAESNLAWAALREGRIAEAAVLARRAHARGKEMGGAYRVLTWITAWPALGANLAEGDLEAAVAVARDLLDPAAQPVPPATAEALAGAVAAAEAGDRATARERLLTAAGLARDPGFL
jgi:class 3 adenylate cyclase/tetratricopeptide (TPR) repeat protein